MQGFQDGLTKNAAIAEEMWSFMSDTGARNLLLQLNHSTNSTGNGALGKLTNPNIPNNTLKIKR